MRHIEFPRVVWEFVAAINSRDLVWLESLFAEQCSVTACGYRAEGLRGVTGWLHTELVEPGIFLLIDDVGCSQLVTTLRIRASDHGAEIECDVEFHTQGRYIESLALATVPEPARVADSTYARRN